MCTGIQVISQCCFCSWSRCTICHSNGPALATSPGPSVAVLCSCQHSNLSSLPGGTTTSRRMGLTLPSVLMLVADSKKTALHRESSFLL